MMCSQVVVHMCYSINTIVYIAISRYLILHFRMSSLRDQVQKEDVKVKETLQHSSQKEAAHGYGGKYGVMKERQDKVGDAL